MRSLKTSLFSFVLLVVLVVQACAQDKIISGISTERLRRYENYIKTSIEQGKIPGAVTLIVRDGVVVQKAAYGYSNLATKTPMNTEDLFYIQSMTKPIITVAFMMLYEEGHFLLTDPVSKYLPDFKDVRVSKDVSKGATGETIPAEREITIYDLLTHTSGLTHGLGQSQLDKDFIAEYFAKPWPDIKTRAANLTKFPLMGQPGKQWYYSAAPDVLSVLIEKFSGKSTDDFLNDRIFKPLGMKDTGYNLSKQQQARVVKLYTLGADGKSTVSTRQPKMEGNTVWSGVNGLYSTAADYLIFCQMLLNDGKWNGQQFLSRKTIEQMTYNHTGNLFQTPGEGFGYGFAVMKDVAASNLLGSNGLFYWSGAYNTHFFIDPKERLISIFMTHEEPFNFYYHIKMRQMVYQAIVEP